MCENGYLSWLEDNRDIVHTGYLVQSSEAIYSFCNIFFFPDIKLLMFYFYSAIRSLPLLLVAKQLTKGSDWRMMCRLLDTLTLIFSWLMNSFNMGWMTPMRWLEGWLQKRLQKTPMWFKIINDIAILPFTSNHQARKKERKPLGCISVNLLDSLLTWLLWPCFYWK